MNKRVNLTQHPATPEQIEAGVFDLTGDNLGHLKCLLTFDEPPFEVVLRNRAIDIAALAYRSGAQTAMIGGAPFLMAPLERRLIELDIYPMYAFSKRESVEMVQDDGSVRKIAVFKHVEFVPACMI